ncbi:MAG: hypothetical protein FWB79_04035 [Treponema sp.]|nr:hypothetical protein [Treponema sp.]
MVDLQKNTVPEMDGLAFIYSGLNNVSDKGREHLRDIAKALLAIQNSPGIPVPDGVCRDIMRKAAGNLP